MSFLSKVFGDPNIKYVKNLSSVVLKIGSCEKELESLSIEGLKEKSLALKERVKNGESLDNILPEAFSLVREAAKRTLNQRHFDVQLIGGIVLHQGKIAEMRTGEGKTLTATLPLYLNALTGKGVHVVTVNDYLAERDAVWMGQIFNLLGLSTSCIIHESAYTYDASLDKDAQRDLLGSFKVVKEYLRLVSRKEAYLSDITYGTNNEFGFDYLKDNLVSDLKDKVQRGHYFAIVDEVDSILIDEARTPLIISGPTEDKTDKYYLFAKTISFLSETEDFEIDEKMKSVIFTEKGQAKVINSLKQDPWAENDISTTHQLEAALKARTLFKKDKDYVVNDGEIIIVDEFTGRMLLGRRYSAGLHQAIEAKENVKVQPESKTYATITFQNYFRMYEKLAGMTGTALTSAEEFDKVYKLDVISIPTNNPMIRQDLPDKIFKTEKGKYEALINEIKQRHGKGQPLLVGTVSIDKNEYLAKILEREGIKHSILNAKNHEREGEIIAQAGKFGSVTIATNMAGRGVDIILGGNPQDKEDAEKVKDAGGLHVIGTERHEARRIDNQLRGRSGRQGDKGSSQFLVSLEDDLMRVFGGDRIKSLMNMLKIPDDQPIETGIISKAIESAQSKVEGFYFDSRNHVLEYDNVMSKHREVFYKKRNEILEKAEKGVLKEYILEVIIKNGLTEQDYIKKEEAVGKDNMKQIERYVCLKVYDYFWMEHLEDMDHLRDSVKLRAYGQQDPLVEYKTEGHKMFRRLLGAIEGSISSFIFQAEMVKQEPRRVMVQEKNNEVGRNDLCPCGSGKKYKKCGILNTDEHRKFMAKGNTNTSS